MSVNVAPPSTRPAPQLEGFWSVVITNAVLGLPAYFVSFLFAYGFRDEVGLVEHTTFLVLIGLFAVVAGIAGAAVPLTSRPRRSIGQRIAVGVPLSLALNSAVVGLGSIVSATHKEENSVSADFSTTTDVLVATVLFLVAATLAGAALYVAKRPALG